MSDPPADDRFAARLRGFGPLGILAALGIFAGNLIFVPLRAILVLLWADRSHTPLREIGFVQPARWVRSLAVGVVFGILLKLVMKSIVMPLLGAPPVNAAFHYIAGNPAALPGILYVTIVGAGFGEETLYRGFSFERLGKLLLGSGAGARAAIVLLTSGLFGLAHYPEQGIPGVQQGAIFGLVFGTIYAVTGRIWMPMLAHAAFDVTAVALIYWDVESEVAHFFFR